MPRDRFFIRVWGFEVVQGNVSHKSKSMAGEETCLGGKGF